MTAAWKLQAEAQLMRDDAPPVLTTAGLHTIATAGLATPPSSATLARWLRDMATATKLQEVIKGVYLNRMGHPRVGAADAAQYVRARSVVSLTWVLEQAGITNNFGDTVTCVIPTEPSWTNPQIGDRKTKAGTFRFFAMPERLVMQHAEPKWLKDVRDPRFDYPRTTPEKALLDWIYLGASTRSRMTRPPMDLDLSLLDMKRVHRVAKHMGIEEKVATWLDKHSAYQADPEVQENQSLRFKL